MLALAAGLAVGAAGCSPLVRREVRFVMPARPATETSPLNLEKFHVIGAKTCPPGPVEEPHATGNDSAALYFKAEPVQGGFDTLIAFRGRHCAVRALGWYDSNGDGVLNAGDYQGTTAVIDAVDRGVFRGNITRAPDLTLTLVP